MSLAFFLFFFFFLFFWEKKWYTKTYKKPTNPSLITEERLRMKSKEFNLKHRKPGVNIIFETWIFQSGENGLRKQENLLIKLPFEPGSLKVEIEKYK